MARIKKSPHRASGIKEPFIQFSSASGITDGRHRLWIPPKFLRSKFQKGTELIVVPSLVGEHKGIRSVIVLPADKAEALLSLKFKKLGVHPKKVHGLVRQYLKNAQIAEIDKTRCRFSIPPESHNYLSNRNVVILPQGTHLEIRNAADDAKQEATKLDALRKTLAESILGKKLR